MNVVVTNVHPDLTFSKNEVFRVVKAVLRREKKKLGILSIVLTTNRRIRRINRHFLGHDYATDVIAFGLEGPPRLEAEIYINLDRARIQAKRYHASFADERRRLLIHGILHILGHRDKTQRDKNVMTQKEDLILLTLKATSR